MLLVQRSQSLFRKPLLVAVLALTAFAAIAGGAGAQSNPEDGEISEPYQYVIRANPAVVSVQGVHVQPGVIQIGK